MAESQVALTLTSGQLWAASVALVGVVAALIVYIYQSGKTSTDARLTGLNNKLNKEVDGLKKEFTEHLEAQNQQLTQVIAAINASSDNLQKLYHDLDKRLYAHEIVVKGKIHATYPVDR